MFTTRILPEQSKLQQLRVHLDSSILTTPANGLAGTSSSSCVPRLMNLDRRIVDWSEEGKRVFVRQ